MDRLGDRCYERLEGFRYGGIDYHLFACWKSELDFLRMEHQPRESTLDRPIAIFQVTCNRVTDAEKMGSNLMSPASDRIDADQRVCFEPLHHLVARDASLPLAGINPHAPGSKLADGHINSSALLLNHALGQPEIGLANGPCAELII